MTPERKAELNKAYGINPGDPITRQLGRLKNMHQEQSEADQVELIMKYQQFEGSMRYNPHKRSFEGAIMRIKKRITYESSSFDGVKRLFKQAVDKYLEERKVWLKENFKEKPQS